MIYTLLAFREGFNKGNVWEKSENINDCVSVARYLFEIDENETDQLLSGKQVWIENNRITKSNKPYAPWSPEDAPPEGGIWLEIKVLHSKN
jgi:hypothetical protein